MAIADTTGTKQQVGRPFKPGQSGNPAGRPKGSRHKVSESFIAAMAADFDLHGTGVIEKVRTEKPDQYLKLVADLVPKDFNVDLNASEAFVGLWKAMSAGTDD